MKFDPAPEIQANVFFRGGGHTGDCINGVALECTYVNNVQKSKTKLRRQDSIFTSFLNLNFYIMMSVDTWDQVEQ